MAETNKLRTSIVFGIVIFCLFSLWVLSPNPDHLSTTPKQDESSLCNTDTYNKGQWVNQDIGITGQSIEAIEKQAGYHCPWDFAHRCFRRENEKGEFNRSKAILDYSWYPDSCDVLPFKPRDFAKHLSKHPLLLVGDSITQLMFESMWCLLGQDMSGTSSSRITGGDTHMWASQLVHNDLRDQQDAVSVAYLRSDYLVKLDNFTLLKPNEDEGYKIGVGSNFAWVHAIENFDYIMLNTGPHWHPDLKWGPKKDRKELLAAFKKAMTNVFDYLKANVKPHQRVWIRSTPYGHGKCSQYKAPSETVITPTGAEGEYEWDMFESFDIVWKDWTESQNDRRFQFFNVSTMANMRGDAHSRPDSDCLHTCIPGPVDDWNKLLYHEITKHFIDQLQ